MALGFSTRAEIEEWMDDPSASAADIQSALHDLRRINGLLGGYRATFTALRPLFRKHGSFHLLDVGTGSGDYLAHVLRWGRQRQTHVEAVGIDRSPATVGFGRAWLDTHLSTSFRPHARIDVGNALALPYDDNAFDVAHAALVLHHFHGPEAVQLLREMDRVSRVGIVINDLHRHPLAYAGIWVLSRLLRLAPMVQHDGPISVRRGFDRSDLQALARAAGLEAPNIRWHWAFRWILSTLPGGE